VGWFPTSREADAAPLPRQTVLDKALSQPLTATSSEGAVPQGAVKREAGEDPALCPQL